MRIRVALPLAFAVIVASSCTPTKVPTVTPGPSRPNIVFIITDDETYAEAQFASTNTHLEADLADKGITFTNAIIPNPLCCPSRTSILRGQQSSTTGLWTNHGGYGGWQTAHTNGLENSTIATWLQQKGYATGLVGKYLNGYENSSWVPPGWSYWRAEEINDTGGGYCQYRVSVQGQTQTFGTAPQDYSVDVMTRFATDFITRTPRVQPLFLYVGYRSPHGPRRAAPRYAHDSRCDNESVADRPDYRVPGAGAPGYILHAPFVTPDLGVVEPVEACRSLLGYMYGEHDWEAKRVPYESSIHVPLAIRYDPLTAALAARGTTA